MTAFRTTLAILLLALASIGGVWFFQLVVKLVPCELCYSERWAWYAAIPLAALALAARQSRWAVRLFVPLFLASAGLAFYHVGVEQHFFAGPSACTAPSTAGMSVEDLTKALLATPPVRCDEVQWSLFGISLAGFNLIASLVAAGLAAWSWRGFARESAA
jgi:disulfide bond formation protein DsbB